MVTQTPPPAPGVSAGSSSTSAALSGKLSPLHLPDGQVGARDEQRRRMATVAPVTSPLGFSFASRCSLGFGGLPALLCYLCGFASCMQFQSSYSSFSCKLSMCLRMGCIALEETTRPPEDLVKTFGLSNMTTTCWREIVFQQFNVIAESLQIKRFWFGFHIKARRGSYVVFSLSINCL